jgi:hypothetical protein
MTRGPGLTPHRLPEGEAPNLLTFRSELAAGSYRLTGALPMTLTRDQLPDHEKTFVLEEPQLAQDILAPLFVLAIAALTGYLEAGVGPPELCQ